MAPILWRLHLASPPSAVYEMLATGAGRARFWGESAEEREGAIHFRFPNGQEEVVTIVQREPFVIEYFGARVEFRLKEDRGTVLELRTEGDAETAAGWVSVLMALKAAVDFGVDLRNHDRERSWDQGYVDN